MYRDTNPTPLSAALEDLKQEIENYRKQMRFRGSGRNDNRKSGGRRGPSGRDTPDNDREEASDRRRSGSIRERFQEIRERNNF